MKVVPLVTVPETLVVWKLLATTPENGDATVPTLALPDALGITDMIAFVVASVAVVPLILVPVIFEELMVVIVAIGEVRASVFVIVGALIVVPVINVEPVIFVKTAVVPVCICPPTIGEKDEVVANMVEPVMLVATIVVGVIMGVVIEVNAFSVDTTAAVPLILVPVKFVTCSLVNVAIGEVMAKVLVNV